MAIYGIGAMYNGTDDVSHNFIQAQMACIGWPPEEAPALHEMLRYIKPGDIIYIKSHPPNVGLIIKSVGIVVGNQVQNNPTLGHGVAVRWIWEGEHRVGPINDRYNVRNLTLYEEFNFDIQQTVLNLLISRVQ